jgi:hypothetical protein
MSCYAATNYRGKIMTPEQLYKDAQEAKAQQNE